MNENYHYPSIEFNLNSNPPRIQWHTSLEDELEEKIPLGWMIDRGTLHTFDDDVWIANLVKGIEPSHSEQLRQIAMNNFIHDRFDDDEWFTVLDKNSNKSYLLNSDMMARLGVDCLGNPESLPAWVKLECDSAEPHEVAYSISEFSVEIPDFDLVKLRSMATGDYLTVSVLNHSPNAVKADIMEYEGPSEVHRNIFSQVERGLFRYIIGQNVSPPWGQGKTTAICQSCGSIGEWRSLFVADTWMGYDNKNKKKPDKPIVIEITKCNGAGRFCESCFNVLDPGIFCMNGTLVKYDT